MPTYQYACPDCGYKFELKQKFTEDPVKRCPHCERRRVYRVVGPVAVSFKGSGWYITDSKSSSEKKTLEHKPKDANAAPAEATGSATDKTEKTDKTDAKSETKVAEPAAVKPSEKAKGTDTANTKPAKKD
jgi:putative FmdB family regulatory protein